MQTIWSRVTPNFAAYCMAHGAASVEAMIAADAVKYPGGKMAGFIIWNSEQLRRWKQETKWAGGRMTDADHAAYDAWLQPSAQQAEAA